jgi:hypothetical protein
MNGSTGKYCGLGLALALCAGGTALAAKPADTSQPPPAMKSAFDAARGPAAYPSLASVPPTPKDVRPLSAWKTAVLTTKTEGASLSREAAVEPWTLHDSEAWAAQERAEATPPAPVTVASESDTEAYAAALRARAMAPSRKR